MTKLENSDGTTSTIRWLVWIGVAVISAPVAIFLHELGHFLVGAVFDFPDLALHFASVSDTADEGGVEPWKQGLQALAGPAVTLMLVFGFTIGAYHYGPNAFTIAPVFAAGVRAVLLGGAYLIIRILYPDQASGGNFDELNAARHLGLSMDFIMALSALTILAVWIYLIKLLPKPIRWKAMGATIVGTVIGLAFWLMLIGPAILP